MSALTAEAEIDALSVALAGALARIDAARAGEALAREGHVRAAETIAAMHAAAVGSVRGPIRGVVEDVTALRESRDIWQRDCATLRTERDELLRKLRLIYAAREPAHVVACGDSRTLDTSAPIESDAPKEPPTAGIGFPRALRALLEGCPIRRMTRRGHQPGPWIIVGSIGWDGGEYTHTPWLRIDTGEEVTLNAEDYLADDWQVQP